MELKLWFSFLLLHVIHGQSVKQWLINVPKKLNAIEGSCVVIPCSYSFPWPPSWPNLRQRTGFWKIGNKVISTSRSEGKVSKEYKYRTAFLGDLQSLNCTMQLEGVKATDVGPFYFRIEMDWPKRYSYSNNPVHIDVLKKPPPPTMSASGKTVACSATHSCPSSAPTFEWSRPGNAIRHTKKISTWQWKSVSTMTLRPGRNALNRTLNCTARYTGGKKATASMIVKI